MMRIHCFRPEPQPARNFSNDLAKTLLTTALLAVLLRAQAPATPPPAGMSDEEEVRLGQVLADKFAAEEGMQPTPQTKKLDEYLQMVGDRVAAHAQRKIPYHFHFDPSPSFRSAVGLPGGQVFVGAGILAYMDSEDQLAMVLGHEVEHIDLNQCRDRLIKVLAGEHLGASDSDKLKVDPFLPGYGREGELAADREGVKLAMQAGYSAEAAMRLLRIYIILGENMPNTPKEAKESLERRIAQIRAVNSESKLPKPTVEKPLALP
jgi:beta-barrel assembly-enhancing protease